MANTLAVCVKRESKTLTLALKTDGEDGEFVATFATLGVIDLDQDITEADAFEGNDAILIGAYGHNPGALPTGKGHIVTDGDAARVEGRFNLNTTSGRDTYEAVKDAGDLMEWSYLYNATEYSFAEVDGKRVRILEKIEVFSVDPVLKGSGIGTGTDAIKSRGDHEARALPITDHIEAVISDLDDLTDRVTARAAARAKDGRTLGADSLDHVALLVTQLDDAKDRLEDAHAGPVTDDDDTPNMHAALASFLRFEQEHATSSV